MSAQSGAAATNLLEVRGLTKIFGSLKACDHVDLTVRKGEIHSLLGENGAGKSTLVKMLFGSLEPNAGEIRWDGRRFGFRARVPRASSASAWCFSTFPCSTH